MNVERTILEDIKDKQLIQFGYVQKRPETRIPKQILQWRSEGRRKQGRSRKSWQSGINEEMREREDQRKTSGETERDGDWVSEDVGRCKPIYFLKYFIDDDN